MADISSKIIDRARDLGFVGVGFSLPQRPLYFDGFTSWLSAHKNAGMSWLEKNLELRENPSLLLQHCRVVISLAYPYSPQKPGTPDGFSASRYSQPDLEDYHYRLRMLCNALCDTIKEAYRGCRVRVCIDSAPLLERSLAYSSGIGFVGKNNMLIIPGFGSYFYLAEILTTAALDIDPVKPVENLCGSCTLCIDSCPAGALEKPYCLNASKCLSYLTVECKEPVNEADARKMGDCFFGCDRCQEVCPINGKEKSMNISLPSTGEFLSMDGEYFQGKFGNTAFARAGLEKIKTNIKAIVD